MGFAHRDEILISSGGSHMKANANGSRSFKNKIALGQNAVSEKRLRLVEDNEVYVGPIQRLSEIGDKPEAVREQASGRDSLNQNSDIEIAIRTDSPVGDRPKNISRLNFASRGNALRNATPYS
jgi:hypothetical protein